MTTVWLAGGSGLVGAALLGQLLEDDAFESVVAVGRRALAQAHPKLVQAKLDFTTVEAFASLAPPAFALSCLGTTIGKAGSREAFRAVDFDAVLTFARAARERGARTLVHVSSLGADPRSRTFYSRVKGEIEEAVAKLGYESVYALRPSILDGARAESRPLERVGLALGRALGPMLGKYRPTPASSVARTMIARAKVSAPGSHVVEADAIS
jgi:uncharacterized protein YbjT (DUF2867 family)